MVSHAFLGELRVPKLFALSAPGVGVIHGLRGHRLDMRQALADRKADGVAFKCEHARRAARALGNLAGKVLRVGHD